MSQRKIQEATTTSMRGSYSGPLQPGFRMFTKKQMGPFIVPTSHFDDAELAYDSYDGKLDVSDETAMRKERIARSISKWNKEHPQDTDEDGNPIDSGGNKSYMAEPINEDLAVWFGTKKKPKGSKQPKGPWVNICRKKEGGGHPPCGRPEASDKGYPKCRAAGVASKMSDSQKKSACQQKRRAEKTNPKSGKGNKPKMVSYKPKNESIEKLVRKLISEIYNPDKLYPVDFLYPKLKKAPFEIKEIVKNLKPIPCVNENGDKKMCVKIPEVIDVYLSGRY